MATRLNNKLSTAEEQIREAYRNGATLRQIGELHEVSPGTVRNKLIELGEEMRPRGRRKKEQGVDDRVLNTDDLPVDAVEDVEQVVTAQAIDTANQFDPTPEIVIGE